MSLSTLRRPMQRYSRFCVSLCRVNYTTRSVMFATISINRRTFSTQKPRFSESETKQLIETANRDGFVILKDHFDKNIIKKWLSVFMPFFKYHKNMQLEAAKEKGEGNRGSGRYYVVLPFKNNNEFPFAEPKFYQNPDILRIVEGMAGFDPVMCELATDTPELGSTYQEIHRDCPPLFPESIWQGETPSFQLAVNFPLVDVTPENGPFEVVRGTHLMSRQDGFKKLENGEAELETVCLNVGDVMIRDVRALHRGTPNKTEIPRPMVVMGYSRRWMFRPEVGIKIEKEDYEKLNYTGQKLLRFEERVDKINPYEPTKYTQFAYDDEGRIIDATKEK